jgi:acyl-CoA synthetase (AMP-forming)/AMP-acid ligase II
MSESSLLAVLRERASLQPDEPSFTFIDYESDWDGNKSETLSWAQTYRRTLNVAHEVKQHGAKGDRAVILAPQSLEYIVGFLGAMQAGLIAVPLSVPSAGAHDERVKSVLLDTAPTVILTTSAVVDIVREYVQPQPGHPDPVIIEVDKLDLETRKGPAGRADSRPDTAYLQYTSGSTRSPAGVMVTYRNLQVNFEQMMADFFTDYGKVAPPNSHAVTWLPFYHDMGLLLGVVAPILGGWKTVVMTPVAFLQRPARWIRLLATTPRAITAGPNFAFELALRKTSDEDMAGLDLGDVLAINSGSERVHAATLKAFYDRFARFNLKEKVLRPSYGLAEATLYVATRRPGDPPQVGHFEPEKLSAGHATRTTADEGTTLVSYGTPIWPTVRIVDPETRIEAPEGQIGEIWTEGENVALGYWQKAEQTEATFHGKIVDPSPGTPDGTWLRTGDLGFISEGELFIMARIKDMLIVYGRNHYPDDIEATINEITRGRVAAIAVTEDRTEKLVAIVEVKKKGDSEAEVLEKLQSVKSEVTSAISKSHGVSVSDLVLVSPGSIPTTTSGKIRRQSCVEIYSRNEFARIDA